MVHKLSQFIFSLQQIYTYIYVWHLVGLQVDANIANGFGDDGVLQQTHKYTTV